MVAMGSRPTRCDWSCFSPAYNRGIFLRSLRSPDAVQYWSLRSVQVRLVNMGGRLVHHARQLVFQMIL